MSQAPSISDVAKAAGVSMKTVSRVINNEANVTEKTKARVLEAIESLSYTPSVSARVLAGNKTYSILFFCLTSRGDYFAQLHFAALSKCQSSGYRLPLALLEDYFELDDEQLCARLETLVRKPYPDGIILIPPFCDRIPLLQFLQQKNIPYVRISPKDKDQILGPAAFFDEKQATDDLIQHVIENGHRRIALVKGNPSHGGTLARTLGYMSALERNNIPVDPMLVFQGDFLFPSGVAAGQQLLSLGNRPTAVFASNDEMAAGVSMAVHKAGLDVPIDVSIVGFDDNPIAQASWPPLTTIRQPLSELAVTAVNWLIEGERKGNPRSASLSYELIKRDSVHTI